MTRARLVGINHVALEVGDLDEALEFYGRLFEALAEAGIAPEPARGLHVRDPWGNVLEIVDYREIQFTKAPAVLAGMGLEGVEKTDGARRELADKGLGG
jgi:catechol 2,3-dioxygenase-like lactoylglutathione lyase family enzyme